MLFYKGYFSRIDFNDENDSFIRHIVGIKDVIGFHGETLKELKTSFYDAVDDDTFKLKKISLYTLIIQ